MVALSLSPCDVKNRGPQKLPEQMVLNVSVFLCHWGNFLQVKYSGFLP